MEKIITTKEITANEIGKPVVGYNCSAGDWFKWRIFHADGRNVYIIMDDYISFGVVPDGREGTFVNRNGTYTYYFDNVVKDYKGSEDITDIKLRKLNESYFKANPAKNTNLNMKAVAYMLDTKAWSKFAGDMAEYAIGGPTLELFVKSYNLTHERKLKICVNKIGYMIKYEDESEFNYFIIGIGPRDDLYFKWDIKKASGMWLASPSAGFTFHVMHGRCPTHYYYYDGGIHCDGGIGFRPFVCLKSGILFKETEEGLKIT